MRMFFWCWLLIAGLSVCFGGNVTSQWTMAESDAGITLAASALQPADGTALSNGLAAAYIAADAALLDGATTNIYIYGTLADGSGIVTNTLTFTNGLLYISSAAGGDEPPVAASTLYPDYDTTGVPLVSLAGFAAFTPPVSNITVHASAPEIAAHSKQTDAGEVFVATGNQFDSGGNGSVFEAKTDVESLFFNRDVNAIRYAGFAWNADTVFEIKCRGTDVTPANKDRIFYVVDGSGEAGFAYDGAGGKYRAYLGDNSSSDVIDYSTNWVTFIYDNPNNHCIINGITNALVRNVTETADLYIGCNSPGYEQLRLDIEYFKIWTNGVLFADAVPLIDGTFSNTVDGATVESVDGHDFGIHASLVSIQEADVDSFALAYGRGITNVCDVLRVSSDGIAVELPSALPSNEVYMVWVGNTNGYSEPIVMNRAEVWWLGGDGDVHDQGDTMYVHGRNLSLGGGDSYLWCEEYDQWFTNSVGNPYRADYTVPAGWTNGTYTLWAHNGFGQKYGWSRTNLSLTIGDAFVYGGSTINVANAPHNATGDGVTDDYNSISNAHAACSSGDTLYFPAGTYAMSYQLTSKAGVKYLGAGTGATTIRPHPDTTSAGRLFDGEFTDCWVQGLTFATINDPDATAELFRWQGDRSTFTNCVFNGIEWEFTGYGSSLATIGADHLTIKNCEFISSGLPGNLDLGERQLVLKDCTFRGANHCSQFLGGVSLGRSITGCTFAPYDDTPTGYVDGRVFVAASGNGLYFANNSTTNCAPPLDPYPPYAFEIGDGIAGSPWSVLMDDTVITATVDTVHVHTNIAPEVGWYVVIDDGVGEEQARTIAAVSNNVTDYILTVDSSWTVTPNTSSGYLVSDGKVYHPNTGEQILLEGYNTMVLGSVIDAEANTITVHTNDNTILTRGDYHVLIVEGVGLGQVRTVSAVSNNVANRILTINEPWRVVPTVDSTYFVGRGGRNYAIYNNSFDGRARWVSSPDHAASVGFDTFGGSADLVVANNHIQEVRAGIVNWTVNENFDGELVVHPSYFNTFIDNTITNVRWGFNNTTSEGDSSYLGTGLLGTIARGNTFAAVYLDALMAGQGATDSISRNKLNVYEGNTITNCNSHGVRFGSLGLVDHIVLDNTFHSGSSEGIGFRSYYDFVPFIRNNEWSGFATNYYDVVGDEMTFGETLWCPVKELRLTAGQSSGSMAVWNVGTASMSWDATESSGWITLTSSNGTIVADGAADAVEFNIGTATGSAEIEIVSGMQTNTLTVIAPE